jgi:putative lipoic acid-binding regulatory protein
VAVSEETLFEFPCDFPIKIVGLASDDFRQLILDIVTKHVGMLADERVVSRPSRDGKYLSLTCTFIADSRAQVDALYSDLTSQGRVLMVL